jgi:hypothetical protein
VSAKLRFARDALFAGCDVGWTLRRDLDTAKRSART